MKPTSQQEGLAAKQAIFQPFLEAEGITPKLIAKETKKELKYKEPVITRTKVLKMETPAAMRVRQAAVDRYHKLRGDYPPDKTDHRFPDGPVKFEVEFTKKGGNGGNGGNGG